MSVINVALTGLHAATTDLQVTGNNIANAGTYGFKQSRTEFSDLFVSGKSGAQMGNGVKVSGVSQEFSQVGFTTTGSNYDMAISGDSFFILRRVSDGSTMYSRAGNLTVDQSGYITNQRGDRLQGYTAANGSITASVGDLKVPTSEAISPAPTANVEYDLNLDSGLSTLSVPFDPNDESTYHNRTSVTITDSLGASHLLNSYYVKTADNTWDVHVDIDGSAITTGNIVYDTSGDIQSVTGLDAVTWNPGGGAAPNQTLAMDYTDSTQYGSSTSVRSIGADGYASGIPSGISIDNDGVISIKYSNGEISPAGQVALARFENPQGLYSVGDTSWSETKDSGRPIVTQDNSIGAINSGTLENSNVDLTEQLVRLITAQRTFQANAQTIRAGDFITQTVINLE